jgi:hypothetical protein
MHRSNRFGLFLAALGVLAGAGRATAAPVPAPWTTHDIGTWERPGSVNLDPRGLWTMRAFNGDILPSVDSTFFVGQPLSGDGSVLALLLGQEGGHPDSARAGVMIREDISEGARNVFLGMTSRRGLGLTFRRNAMNRTQDEGADGQYGPRQFPVWIRLQRQGDQITPFTSSDGFGWSQVHSPITLAGFSKDALVGLAESSLFSGPLTAVFANPTVAPGQISPLVQMCTGSGTVLLTWTPVAGAVGYVVRRGAPDVPGFAADMLTPRALTETSFTDSNLPNGRPLRYLISPIFKQGEEELEGWATAVTTVPLSTPLGLLACDIDLESTRLVGSVQYDPSTDIYRLTGSGSGIWDTSDHFFFASKPVDGDVQITARVLERPDYRGGVMLRESLEGNSRMVLLSATQQEGVTYSYRDRTGAATSWPGQPVLAAREFTGTITLRLVRKGNTVTPFLSSDGTTFTQAGAPRAFSPPLAKTLYVGLAQTSQNPGRQGASHFGALSIGPAP